VVVSHKTFLVSPVVCCARGKLPFSAVSPLLMPLPLLLLLLLSALSPARQRDAIAPRS